jgi:hypothetical protein
LDFKGVDTQSARYQNAISRCARKLLGKISLKARKGHTIRLSGIHIRGIHLKALHVGRIEIPAIHAPNIKIGSVNVPSIHVTTPAPSGAGPGASSGEPPTQAK